MRRRLIAISLFAMTYWHSSAQNQTISKKPAAAKEAAAVHKAMLVPFEPRLYMSEIDRSIHFDTKLSAKQIKHLFRDGLNEQLEKALKASRFNVLDLMSDTTRYRKETEAIYQYIVYEYMRVPDQQNYKPPVRDKQQQKAIDKGQLTVETNGDARFMNARLSNSRLVPGLYSKYKTDLFIFINQLDLKASGSKDPMETGTGSLNRKIVVHYTVYTVNGVEVNSGIVEEEFDPLLNNPRKIIDRHFSRIAATISERIVKGLAAGQR